MIVRRTVNRWVRIALIALALAGATAGSSFGDVEASPARTNYWCTRC